MARPPASRAAATLALTAAVLVAGCGASDQATFKKDYPPEHRAVRAFGNDVARTFGALQREDATAVVLRLRSLNARAKSLDARLGALNPPSAAQPTVASLRQALGALRGDLTKVASAIQLYNPGGWLSATTEASADLAAMRRFADTVPTQG